jgi:uncharacterized protein YvpB
LTIMLLTATLPANTALLQQSTFAPQVLAYDRELMAYVPPYLKQAYQNKRDQLVRSWNSRRGGDSTAAQPTP